MPASTIGVNEYPRECDFTQDRSRTFGHYPERSWIVAEHDQARTDWPRRVSGDSPRHACPKRVAGAVFLRAGGETVADQRSSRSAHGVPTEAHQLVVVGRFCTVTYGIGTLKHCRQKVSRKRA